MSYPLRCPDPLSPLVSSIVFLHGIAPVVRSHSIVLDQMSSNHVLVIAGRRPQCPGRHCILLQGS